MRKYSATYDIPRTMNNIIENHTIGLGATGIAGGLLGPGADLPIIAGSWVTMTISLADEAGHKMNNETAKKVCLAVATGGGAFLAGAKIAATAAGWIGALFTVGISLAASAAGNAALNAAFTSAYGKACARYFLQTTEIDDTEALVSVLISLTGAEMGINMGDSSLLK